MIKINLLPPTFKAVKKQKKKSSPGPAAGTSSDLSSLPWKQIAFGAGGLFLALTLYFYFDYILLSKRIAKINTDMAVDQPKMQSLKTLENEVSRDLVPERDFLMTHVLNKTAATNVLQKMSEDLPDGIWLNGFTMNNSGKDRSFRITGLAVNIENKTNIEQIEEYLQKLKLVVPNSQFTYSTSTQLFEKAPVTAFDAEYKWKAD